MAGRVQDFITLRIGSLWLDVPLGPLHASDSAGSMCTTAASPAMIGLEQEVNSKPHDGFIPVVSKAAKRRARRMAARSRVSVSQEHPNKVHKVASSSSGPPGFSKPKVNKSVGLKLQARFRHTTLGEWSVCIKQAPPTKFVQSRASSTSTPKETTPTLTPPNMLGVRSSKLVPSILGAPPTKTVTTTNPISPNEEVVLVDQHQHPQPCNKGKVAMVEKEVLQPSMDKGKEVVMEYNTSSSKNESHTRPQLRVEAPEFIPSPVYNPGLVEHGRVLRWQGIGLTNDDIRKGHVDPTATLSDPISSEIMVSKPSVQGSMSPKRHRRHRRNNRRTRANLIVVDSAVLTNAHRSFIVDMILTQHQESCRRIQDAARRAMQASLERTICQDLNKLLPGVSMSGDDINGEIMRRTEAFAQWPEYQEWVKRNPQRKKYVKQAVNVRASRAANKRRELALPADSLVDWTVEKVNIITHSLLNSKENLF
ncbi:hypothetical protein ZEAMMB73_Zm00001d042430 [Zea mays]|uniref:Uncharacterized protein n=1 Tax=Zea mays TaxID=4577 RepID=A0A1D6N3P8_MAIZE|nr:hypothetical protein ZEAMMB73_Zm00001d042430 [Zea mays]